MRLPHLRHWCCFTHGVLLRMFKLDFTPVEMVIVATVIGLVAALANTATIG